jgi:hypothetical protein
MSEILDVLDLVKPFIIAAAPLAGAQEAYDAVCDLHARLSAQAGGDEVEQMAIALYLADGLLFDDWATEGPSTKERYLKLAIAAIAARSVPVGGEDECRVEALRLAYKTGYNEGYEDGCGLVDHDAAEEGWGQYLEQLDLHARLSAQAGGDEVENLARLLCDAELPRIMARQEEAPLFDDSEGQVRDYWREIAALAARNVPVGGEDAARSIAAIIEAGERDLDDDDEILPRIRIFLAFRSTPESAGPSCAKCHTAAAKVGEGVWDWNCDCHTTPAHPVSAETIPDDFDPAKVREALRAWESVRTHIMQRKQLDHARFDLENFFNAVARSTQPTPTPVVPEGLREALEDLDHVAASGGELTMFYKRCGEIAAAIRATLLAAHPSTKEMDHAG